MAGNRFLARMSLENEIGVALSDTRIRLLEEIGRKGSINQAAKAVPLSYKAAWDAIDTLNNLAPEPLVVRVIGGRQGGGTELTEYGRKMVAMYRALEIEYQAALDRLSERLDEAGGCDVGGFRQLMRRMSMKTSAATSFPASSPGCATAGWITKSASASTRTPRSPPSSPAPARKTWRWPSARTRSRW